MITLPQNFEADIQGQNLNLYPIVIIGNFEGTYNTVRAKAWMDNSIHLSTKSFSHSAGYGSGQGYTSNTKPLLLNIPSIKESMDFENRNYKISNVTLKISNYEYEGERFSDNVDDNGEPLNLINMEVRIFWWSQSTKFLMPTDKFPSYVEEYPTGKPALMVYKGFVRRYSHDDENVTLSLEDASQKDLHKDVPVTRLGDGVEVLPKFKNVPIPMVYGYVDKSPCVIKSTMADEYEDYYLIKIASDSMGNYYVGGDITIGNHTLTQSALYFYKNDTYYNCSKNMFDDPETEEDESDAENFTYNGDLGEINFNYPNEGENLTQINALGVYIVRETKSVKNIQNPRPSNVPPIELFNGFDGGVEDDFPEGTSNVVDGNLNTFCLIKDDAFYTGVDDHGYGSYVHLDLSIEPFSALDPAEEINDAGDIVESKIDTYFLAKITHNNQPVVTVPPGYVSWGLSNAGYYSGGNRADYSETIEGQGIILNDDYNFAAGLYVCQDSYDSIGNGDLPLHIPTFTNTDTWSAVRVGIPPHRSETSDSQDPIFFSIYTKIYGVFLYQKLKVNGIVDKTYYVNVNGRHDDDYVNV